MLCCVVTHLSDQSVSMEQRIKEVYYANKNKQIKQKKYNGLNVLFAFKTDI